MSKFELLEVVIDLIDELKPETADSIVPLLKKNNITSGMHVGQSKEFFENKEAVAEWYLGQFFSIINNQAWHAMNSLINQGSRWLKDNA